MSIVKMKRLRLIGMQAERESLLRLLQHMGCVEIDEPPHLGDDPEWAALTRPDPCKTGFLMSFYIFTEFIKNNKDALITTFFCQTSYNLLI